MVQIIGGTYTSTIDLGTGRFSSQVAITGAIDLGFNPGDAIFASASVANAYVLNEGNVVGGLIGSPGETGCGIYFGGVGVVSNGSSKAIIRGGNGTSPDINAPPGASGYAGGIGVDLNDGGTLTNQGLVAGGTGGFSLGPGGEGGAGVVSTYGPATVRNSLTIYGGNGGGEGSASGGRGGNGVALYGGGSLVNGSAAHLLQGLISGGDGGAGGGNYGGVGVLLDEGTVAANYGEITGGGATTANHDYQNGDAGGIGLFGISADTVTNAGLIAGGQGSNASITQASQGGIGVELINSSALINTGSVIGGAGGECVDNDSNAPGAGGVGLWIGQSAGAVSNAAIIKGGTGGNGYMSGGAGGAGVSLEGGDIFTDTGTITGGNGGYAGSSDPTGSAGAGGAGVYLNGGVLITSGTITGGAGNFAGPTLSRMGDAVQFGAAVSTLVVDPTALFNGYVVANAAVSDTLELAGTTPGSLSGLGTEFTGFKTVTIESNANWSLVGTGNTLPATGSVNVDGSLNLDGELVGVGAAKIARNGLLDIGAASELEASTLALSGGTLTCAATGTVVLGTTLTGAKEGGITLEVGHTVSGFGTIFGQVAGLGTLAATGGTLLILDIALSSTVTATVAAASTLDLSGGGTLGSISGAGTLKLDGSTPYVIASGKTPGVAAVTLDPKVALSGFGTLTATVSDAGILTASGGTLSLHKSATGNGTFAAASGATLDFLGGVTTAGTFSGAGTVRFDAASTLDAGVQLQATKLLATANLTLGASTSVSNTAGHEFVLDPAAGGTVALGGAAGDKFINAGVFTNDGAGTADVSVAFVNAATVSTASGSLSFLGAITNNGTIDAASGVLSLASEALGTGMMTIASTGTLALQEGAASGQSIVFGSTSGLLDLANPLTFDGVISDFRGSDRIDLLNTAATSFSFAHGTLTVENGSEAVAKLAFAGNYKQADFAIGSDGHGGTVVTFT